MNWLFQVVQFEYGGDGLDPMMMEGKDKPVDFYRVLEHIKAVSPYQDEDPIDEDTIVSSAQELLDRLEGPSKEFKQVTKMNMLDRFTRLAFIPTYWILDKNYELTTGFISLSNLENVMLYFVFSGASWLSDRLW